MARPEVFHAGPFRFPNGVAIDPDGHSLYVAQSTASNIVRIPLDEPERPDRESPGTPFQPGLCPMGFAPRLIDGTLVIGCYKPDAVLRRPPRRVFRDNRRRPHRRTDQPPDQRRLARRASLHLQPRRVASSPRFPPTCRVPAHPSPCDNAKTDHENCRR